MAKISEFIDQVVKENKKITWASKKEIMVSVIMVILMVAVASLCFLGIDVLLYKLINIALNIGGK